MKSIKRGLAVFLAMLLIMPALPVSAENLPDDKVIAADMTGEGDKTPDTEETENNQEDTPTDAEPTDAPEESQTPEPVESPEATQAPEETSSPDATDAPEASPEVTDEPEATASPEETAVPDATASPEETASPEADATPSGTPEGTTAPTASVAPTAAVTPTGTSQATPTATASSTPGVTPTATVSATPSTTPTATPSATPSATPTATPSATPSLEDIEIDEVCFNTGNHVWSVVNQEAFELGAGDVSFEEDGNYTINIPEENPFFPYEVQFTYEDEVTNEWFMTPDDSVEIGGHTFYVSAHFDGTAVTRMSLNVAGDTVIVWPEEKEFTDDGDGELLTSLLPLEERSLRVNLLAYTPVELTMVSVSDIFTGNDALTDMDKVIWRHTNNYDYTVSSSGDKLDLSYRTSEYYSGDWEMIVGDSDQLAAANVRYKVNVLVRYSKNWLTPSVYTQDSAGGRTKHSISKGDYEDSYYGSGRRLTIYVPSDEMDRQNQAYISISPSVSDPSYDHIKVYEGQFSTAEEAMSGLEITEQICCTDMEQINAGYLMEEYKYKWITMVAFDADSNVIGCLPFELYWGSRSDFVSSGNIYKRSEYSRWEYVSDNRSFKNIDGCEYETITLYKGYPANDIYYLTMDYYKAGVTSNRSVTAAFVGQYSSIAEADSAGAADIKNELFSEVYTDGVFGGYGADYSQGVYFTIFVGQDGSGDQKIFRYCVKTVEGENPVNSGTYVGFEGLKDRNEKDIPCYVVSSNADSYGEKNYITILVGSDVDLTYLAPVFSLSEGATLHAEGRRDPEVSGKSYHDFSTGPVQYGITSEDGKNSAGCWLQVIKEGGGIGQLYINSLADKSSDTKTENGVILSTREVILDGYHNYRHDILAINTSANPIPSLAVELESDVVQLDEYWTLSGNHDLSGFVTTSKETTYGELPNLAKIRLRAKDNVADGSEVTGTLTFKSGGNILMILNLSGTVGDPCITTPDIPEAVKYVPYGPMILNNNKYYSWNKVSYSLADGVLPTGVKVEQNGEIYGVPKETGEFTFTIRMDNSYSGFKPSLKTYTLTVLENTDTNVDDSTDPEYNLTQRVQNVYISASGSTDLSEDRRTLVSQGNYDEFKYVFLDGVMLTEGQDYTSESGSTRITIMWQTLLSGSASTPGTHTIGIEFRNGKDEILKRAAQNFVIEKESDSDDGGDSGNDSGSSGAGGDSGGNSDSGNAGTAAGGTGAGGLKGTKTEANGIAGASAGAGVTGQASTVSYTVGRGDTLWKIAEKFYGDGSYWQKIFAENAAVIGSDPNRIYVGQILTIYLNQGDGSVMTAMPAEGMEGIEGNYYIVQEGDTLWKIALKIYNRGWRWRRIYEANVNSIPDPQNIYVGQVLLIPD